MTNCFCGQHTLPDPRATTHDDWLAFKKWMEDGKPALPGPDVTEQVELPSEPGAYISDIGGIWTLNAAGEWNYMMDKEGTTATPGQTDRTELDVLTYAMPLRRLTPAGSAGEATIREAALRDAAAAVSSPWDAETQQIRAAILALVPAAEGEKAPLHGMVTPEQARSQHYNPGEGKKA